MPARTWHDETTARATWRDAPASAELLELLETSKEQCIQYATDLPPTEYVEPVEGISASWRMAHLLQARALQVAKRAGNQDTLGMDGMTVSVKPMDWHVKQLLRPRRRRPGIG